MAKQYEHTYVSAFDSFHPRKSHTTEYDPFSSASTTELVLILDLFPFLLPLPMHSSRDVTQSCHVLSNLGRD